MLALPRQDADRLGFDHGFFTGFGVGDVLDQVRPEHDAIIGHHRHRLRQLNRRIGVVALADADRDGFASKPLLLFRATEAALFPFRRRQHAFRFAFDIDAGLVPQTDAAHEPGDAVDAHVVGQHVIVGVAGLHDRLVHIDNAVPPLLVVTEGVPAKDEEAGVGNRLGGSALAGFQCCQGHEWLEG